MNTLAAFSRESHLSLGEVEFPGGLPGFESHHRFVLMENQRFAPLVFLQSLDADLRFILIPADCVDRSYHVQIEPWDRMILFPQEGPEGHDDLKTYFVLTLSATGVPTINMVAPVVIRSSAARGVQAVRSDSRYSCTAPLMTLAVQAALC